MKNFEEILPLILAVIIAVFLFLGVIKAITKSLKPPSRHNTIDTTMDLKEQKWRMDEIRRNQKQLLRDQKQKIRDMQRQ